MHRKNWRTGDSGPSAHYNITALDSVLKLIDAATDADDATA